MVTRFQYKSRVSVCSWRAIKITRRATVLIVCWKSHRVIRKCCVLPAGLYSYRSLGLVAGHHSVNGEGQVGDDEHRDELQRLAWIGLMDQARADLGSEGLKTWWKNQSRKTRQQVPCRWPWRNILLNVTIMTPPRRSSRRPEAPVRRSPGHGDPAPENQ